MTKKRKKYIILLVGILLFSCEDYLDKAPEAGLTTEEVFSKYENFRSFFDAVYTGTSNDDPSQGPNKWYNYNITTSYNLYLTQSDLRSNGRR